MATIAGNGPYVTIDDASTSPPKSTSSASPPTSASHLTTRYPAFVRGQNSPFPATPTSAGHNTSLEPPPGVSYAEFLANWNDAHVARWLNDIKCGLHAQTFKTNDIRGDVLLELDQSLLKEMGITSIGDRLRIINGVKALRARTTSRTTSSSNLRPNPPPQQLSARGTDQSTDHSANNGGTNRQEHRRPPPLVLNSNTNRPDLPHIVRDHPPDSAQSTRTTINPVRPLPQPNPTPSTTTTHATTPNPSRPVLPPLPPIPRTQPPQPPMNRTHAGRVLNSSGNSSGRRTPTQDPPAFTQQTLPPPPPPQATQPHQWSTKSPDNRAASPLGQLKRGGANTVHTRSGSLGTSQSNGQPHHKMPIRPSTGSTHPYANSSSALQPPASTQAHNLSPINESFSSQHSVAGTPSPPSFPSSRAYGSTAQAHGAALSLDDLKRKLVKFLLPDESQKFTIDVADCTSGVEILEKALKKVEKGGTRFANDGEPTEHIQSDENGLSIDGWGVYLDLGTEDGPAAPLTGNELLAICQDRDHPIREQGLTLRRTSIASRAGNASPAHGKFLQAGKYTKRASSISILSGLGVHDPEKALDPASPTPGRISPSPLTKRPSKLRNFFGQRPPSELITTHLTEYFPFTEKKVLERTARHSIMRSSRRDSNASSLIGNGITPSISSGHDVPPLPDKLLRPVEDVPCVSLSTEDGRSVDIPSEESTLKPSTESSPRPQLLPPIPFPTESISDAMKNITNNQRQRPLSRVSTTAKRMSYMTELRSKRDRTDTASLMTVDEITAEMESRGVNNAQSGGSSESDEWTKVENEESEDEADAADEQQENENETDASYEEEEDDGPAKAMTSKGGKWIKGALIGAGSFGKVYLGMDAANGLLMAVKQVELASAAGPNYERKKSMLSALEREIELLKDLQHENIVQYLYSSIDDEFLNIFLEYVPGGSVTALLRNYGAFEEPLVKNFVRQILQGLSYLHERDIIHRDIKGANILVDNKGGVKISDFGISKKVDDNAPPIGGNRMHRPSLQGSVFWMAPEVVKQSVHTQKADIWSVGCLVVEMLTGEHPWAQLTQMQAIFKIGSSAQPTIPSDISTEAQDFLQQAFRLDHTARPTAAELLRHPWIGPKGKSKASSSS